MTIEDADYVIVRPMLSWMEPPYDTPEAHVLLLAIGWQESKFAARVQRNGPARGFWQFEFGRGAAGWIFCTSTAAGSKSAVAFRGMARSLHFATTDPLVVRNAIGSGADSLACIMARWLLWTDPQPLPALGDVDAAWDYYVRTWRPGAATGARAAAARARWAQSYELALGVVRPA